MVTQLFIWWLIIQAMGLAALPLTTFLLRALPDHGYAFSKAFGLLLTGYSAWLLAMLGLAPFGAPLLIFCILLIGAVGLLLILRERSRTNAAETLRSTLLPPLTSIFSYEILFLAALIFLALLRGHEFDNGFIGPNPWGTERPMDFAFFNAIQRSSNFPPHDPWLSGYSINYYYFGYLLMASVALLSHLEPSVTYNLSLALIFALTALGIAGIVANLIALSRKPATVDRKRRTLFATLGYWCATFGSATLVLFAANQGAVLQIISGTPMILALRGPDMARAVINGLGPRAPLYLEQEFKGWDFDGTRVITPTNMIEQFNWWNPSRALWDDVTVDNVTQRYYTITEFPFFSFWLGDMHPHVMALPFGLLALALVLHTLVRSTAPPFTIGRRGWLELILTGVVLGSLYTINSWDFPTYLLLFLGALLLLHFRLAKSDNIAQETESQITSFLPPSFPWKFYLGQVVMVGLAAVLLFMPFYLTVHSLVGGKAPLINLPIFSTITRTIGFVTWDKTSLHTFLIIFGLFLVPLVAYLLAQSRALASLPPNQIDQDITKIEEQNNTLPLLTGNWQLRFASTLSQPKHNPLQLIPWVTLGTLVFGLLIGFPLLVLLPLALYAVILAVARLDQPAPAFVLWTFAVACLICIGTEVVYIRDSFEGASARMNTIFKFYYQVWLLWGVLAGYALWWLYKHFFSIGRITSYITTLLFVPLLVGALCYPCLTAGKAFRESTFVGLVGKTPRQDTPAGKAAIQWLRLHASPTAVILEAVGPEYDTVGRGGVTASTGLSTVLGWPGHQQQWRGGDPTTLAIISPREADVMTIYSTTNVSEATALLNRYQVDYIYVGNAEQTTYPAEGLAKLPQLGKPVFKQDEVTIYQVER